MFRGRTNIPLKLEVLASTVGNVHQPSPDSYREENKRGKGDDDGTGGVDCLSSERVTTFKKMNRMDGNNVYVHQPYSTIGVTYRQSIQWSLRYQEPTNGSSRAQGRHTGFVFVMCILYMLM